MVAVDKNLMIAVVLALILGAAVLLVSPLVYSAVIFGLVFVIGTVKFNKQTVLLLGIFLLFQDLIISKAGGFPAIGTALRRTEELVILIAFTVLLFKNFFTSRVWKNSGIDLLLSCLVIFAVLSSIINRIVPLEVAAFDLLILLKGFFIFYVVFNLNLGSEEISHAVKLFSRVFFLILLCGILDLIFSGSFRQLLFKNGYMDYRFGILSVQSIFPHPGIFGWSMSFCMLFAVSFFLFLKKKRYLVFAILFGLAMLSSMRFKPLAGSLTAICIAFIVVPRNWKESFLFVAAAGVIFFTVFFGTKSRLLFEDQLYTYFQSPVAGETARNVLYGTSFRIAHDFFPLGSGLGTFGGWISSLFYSPIYNMYHISTVYGLEKGGAFITDTFWPYVIGQFGFFGGAAYMLILLAIFRKLIKIFKSMQIPFLKAFVFAAIMILIESVVESFAEPIFLRPPQFFFIFAVIGAAFSLPKLDKKEQTSV